MGIFGASKEYVDALDEKQRQVVRGIAKTVELQGTNIARLTGRADGLQRLIIELTEKVVSWGKITSENTRQIGELIDRLSTFSADLAELDKRVSALEEARTQVVFETANIAAKKLPAARGAQYEIGDVHDATQTQRRCRPAIERFERRVAKKLGGSKMFMKKLSAKVASIRIEGPKATSGKGYGIGRLRIKDEMILDKDGEFKPGSCTVDFSTVQEREQLKKYIRQNYNYIIKGSHA